MSSAPIHCDVLIIGAGIAGISIAERISREAKRQNKHIRILVADSAPMLASGSSSGLQGWFHTGSLYTRLDSSESYLNCVKSHKILERDYANAQDFNHHLNCNLNLDTQTNKPWFGDSIQFVLDKPDQTSWTQQVHAMTTRLRAIGCSFDPSKQIDTNRYTTISTTDRSMMTCNIISSLADSAISNGTKFLTGHRAIELQGSDTNEPITLENVNGLRRQVHASHTLITTGYNIPNQPHITFSRRSGVIVSTTPCLDAPNIVRVAQDPANNVSHIAHPSIASNETGFSAIGDSTSLSDQPTPDECIKTAHHIMHKIKSVFGNQAFDGRRIAWHMARKIEVATLDKDSRTFGPKLYELAQNRYAVIPSKFSLFPALANMTLVQLIDDGLFENLNAPATNYCNTSKPYVAPMLSQQALGITPIQTPAYRYSGKLNSVRPPDSSRSFSMTQF